ncbi:hypothetical protein N9242_07765 [Vicingaceae bacterium]|jgi:hypothetical protein|nr:hypothetical protein [Vicingaceae bacterium]
MKKVLLLAVVVGGIAFTSCSKKGDYTCTCTATSGGASASSSTVLSNVTEDDAKEACDAGSATSSITTCTLD